MDFFTQILLMTEDHFSNVKVIFRVQRNKQKTSDEIKLSDRQWSCTSRHSELRIPYCYFKLNITNTLLCITLYLPIVNSDVVK